MGQETGDGTLEVCVHSVWAGDTHRFATAASNDEKYIAFLFGDCMLEVASNYEHVGRIGEGTFGEVYKARDVRTGAIVAIKRVRLRDVESGDVPSTALREMRALQELRHPNVVSILGVYPQGPSLAIVFECMACDLGELIRSTPRLLSEAEAKCIMKMLLQGVAYCHANAIVHRDLKPSNLLLSTSGQLKVGDFGLARVHAGERGDYTPQVATRWYRAPELLFGARKYGFGVDLWAVGAILAELLDHGPLFPGENDIDQIFRVIQVLGTPTPANWPGVDELPDYSKLVFPTLRPLDWSAVLPGVSPTALDLLSKLVVFDPANRLSAAEALKHPWFFSQPVAVDCSELPIPVKDPSMKRAPAVPDSDDASDSAFFHAVTSLFTRQ